MGYASTSNALTSVEVARLLLRTASLAGADARGLAADADLPAWSLSAGTGMIPARQVTRLWELLEHALGDPHVGLTVAGRRVFGDFGLFDYLITASTDALGTRRVDFGAPAATFTFRTADLDLPLPTADPVLATILGRYAAVFPAPEPATWQKRFQQLLDEALDAGSPSLGEMARQ